MPPIISITGRGLPLRGDDLDTDRIMPARFLRAVTFEGLEQHVFEDDRKANPEHPFNDPRYQGAAVLIVNRNFGCGSSREHAPQGLARLGVHAIIGESFSEIFLGNASLLGVPCFTADRTAIDRLQSLVEQAPETPIEARVDTCVIKAGPEQVQAHLPAGVRDGFLTCQWNPTSLLLGDFGAVQAVAGRLPYLNGF